MWGVIPEGHFIGFMVKNNFKEAQKSGSGLKESAGKDVPIRRSRRGYTVFSEASLETPPIQQSPTPLFLMGRLPGDLQEGNRHIKAFGERPIKEGKRPIKANRQFSGTPALGKTAPLKPH